MLESYKVCLCFIMLLVIVCTVGYVCLFCMDVGFLSMIIYEGLYTVHDVYGISFAAPGF